MGIGNTLGHYVKASEATRQCKYTSYARICVYMNISKAIPGAVTLEYQDEDWVQTLDYEHIPFRCRRCHEHGHLFRDCPLIKQAAKASDTKQTDGFIPVTTKRRNPAKKQSTDPKHSIATKNPYEILEHLPEEEEVQNPLKHSQRPLMEDKQSNPPPKLMMSTLKTKMRAKGKHR
jgi:hypothetical protein